MKVWVSIATVGFSFSSSFVLFFESIDLRDWVFGDFVLVTWDEFGLISEDSEEAVVSSCLTLLTVCSDFLLGTTFS